MKPLTLLGGAALLSVALSDNSMVNISASDPRIVWTGRVLVDPNDGGVMSDWEGTQATFIVDGSTTILAYIADPTWGGQRWDVYLKNAATGGLKIRSGSFVTSQGQQQYVVYMSDQLSGGAGPTEVSIMRQIEPCYTGAGPGVHAKVLAFAVQNNTIKDAVRRPRRLEIYGDSITAAMGALGSFSSGCWPGPLTNSFSASYANLLCHAFDAECSVLAWTGIALYEGYSVNDTTLPELYPYALPTEPSKGLWNFSSFVPQAVVINLGTNDWCCNHGNNATFVAAYVATYVQFLTNLTTSYGGPAANVTFFLGVGPMSNGYAEAVQQVITLATAAGMRAEYLPLNVTDYGEPGCEWHPSVLAHYAMAQEAAPVMAATLGWNFTLTPLQTPVPAQLPSSQQQGASVWRDMKGATPAELGWQPPRMPRSPAAAGRRSGTLMTLHS